MDPRRLVGAPPPAGGFPLLQKGGLRERRRLPGALAGAPAALALGGATKEPKRRDPPQPRASKRRKGVKSPDKHVDVAIVGAGAVGAWTAWHLVRQGLDVRLFDAYGAGNGRAASNLPTMLYDPAQGGDALYADLAHDSLPLWQRLSDSASLPIVTPCAAVSAATQRVSPTTACLLTL